MHDIIKAAYARENKIISFLQDLIRIPSLSTQEGPVIARIAEEMYRARFDEVRIDGIGNIVGRIGSGQRVIAMDAHIDTVAVNDKSSWKVLPFEGKIQNGHVFGRGAVDQKAGMAALVYAGELIKELDLEDDFTLYVVGSVQEEDCDGLCWQYLYREEQICPECVILTEPSKLCIHIGHRGRTEIKVKTKGKAAHGSAPERGVNAVYEMAHVLAEIEKLNDQLPGDPQLGKGSVTVSHITCGTPSLCSVPDECIIHLDRRLTLRDTPESVIDEVKQAVDRAGETAEVFIDHYSATSHRGLQYGANKFFPAWILNSEHVLLEAAKQTYKNIFSQEPIVGTWQFSTNGVATNGIFNIPTIGLGPGNECFAHAIDERVPINEVLMATAWYACFPKTYSLSQG